MEITELNLLSDFESQIFPISTLSRVPKIYSLCKWTALILAILAAFSGLIARTKFLILKISRIKIFSSSTIDSIKLLNSDDFDYEYDDDIDDTCSSVSSDYNEDYEERDSSSEDESGFISGGIGRGFSWSDFSSGKSVVRLWDNITAGFDSYETQPEDDVVSVWAEKANNGGVFLGLYDSRVSGGLPEMTAEWPSLRRRWVNSGGVERVYVRDDVTGNLTVGDLRNVKSPLDGRMDSEALAWWDANAVIKADYH